MDVIVGGAIYWLPDHPATCHAKPVNSKSTGAGRYQLLFRCGMPTASSLAWKDFSPKVRTLWHCEQIGWAGANKVIDRGDIRQAIDRCSNIWASLPGAGYGQFEHKADSLIAKFKEAGGTVREIDVWAESPRLSPLWLSASSSACHGLLIITVITPLPTKPSATKMPENWSWRTRQLLTCRCVSVMLLRSMQKYTKELADAKAENDALRDDVAGRRRLHIKAVCQSVWRAYVSGVDNAASPDWQTPLNGIISPSERGWSML